MHQDSPGIILDSARVLAYAIIDDAVTYRERKTFYVDGKLLGAVPRLALCQNVNGDEVLIFHCDNDWNVLGAGSSKTLSEAKSWVEKAYIGISTKWVDTHYTQEQATEYLDQAYANDKCSFCGKWPLDVNVMVGTDVRICNYCIVEFYDLINQFDEKSE